MSTKSAQVLIAPEERWYLRPGILLRTALALTFLVYVRTVAFDFVYDDHLQIALDPWLDSWRYLPRYFTGQLWAFLDFHVPAHFYRPMLMVWFAAIRHLLGAAPGWYHLATILLHLVVVMEAFLLLRLLFRDDLTAAMAAALFALHPAKVEDVAWIEGSTELLWVSFFLGGLICYLRACHLKNGTRWTIAALALFSLALFSKEQAIVTPAILAVYEFWNHRGKRLFERARITVVAIAPYVLITAIFWAIRFHIMHGVTSLSGLLSVRKTLLTQPLAWLWYLRHLVFPWHLSLFYPDMIVRQFTATYVLLPAIALLLIGGVAWHFARQSAEGVLLLAVFVLTLAPPAAMVLLVQVHDRYLYLPSLVAAAAVALAIRRRIDDRRVQIAAVSVLALIFVVLTFKESGQWESDITVMERGVQSAPENKEVRMILAESYIEAGQEQRGVAMLREMATRDPENIDVWQQLGTHEYTIGQYESAHSDFIRAVNAKHFVDKSYSLYCLGLVSLRLGRASEAEQWARQAIAADSHIPSYHLALASILEAQGRRTDAEQERRLAASLKH